MERDNIGDIQPSPKVEGERAEIDMGCDNEMGAVEEGVGNRESCK